MTKYLGNLLRAGTAAAMLSSACSGSQQIKPPQEQVSAVNSVRQASHEYATKEITSRYGPELAGDFRSDVRKGSIVYAAPDSSGRNVYFYIGDSIMGRVELCGSKPCGLVL